mmetsp:Transcript_20739/g.43409  ORF Transcript_20739/g.43409 Transcript_20739/m.43409 type:complete len:299 (+) Transcript_20739:1138-2034(+)
MPGNTIAADTNNNKNTSPSTKTNTNTTQKTTFGQWLTKDDKWIPLKLSWLCNKLPLTSSLHNPDTIMPEEDSSNHQELETLQQMLSKLQSAEVENKKMRDSFAAYRAEKCQNTVQAKSDINLLNQCLVQTTTDLQQQLTLLQQEQFKDVQRIDSRIAGIENATNALTKNTQTTSNTVHDIKSHLKALQHSLESSTKKAVTETVNSTLRSFMLKFTNLKRLCSDAIHGDAGCMSPEHKKPASLTAPLTPDQPLSQQNCHSLLFPRKITKCHRPSNILVHHILTWAPLDYNRNYYSLLHF